MRYISFTLNGRASYGTVDGRDIHDLGARVGRTLPTLRSYLEALARGGGHPPTPPAVDCRVDDVTYLPPVVPGKILCVGLNYVAHREETGRTKSEHPTLFMRFPDTLTGHRCPLVRPRVSTSLDYEGELAVVIGKAGRGVTASKAMDMVAGYACFNDASVRDWQWHSSQFTAGKNFPTTGPFGPELVTADEVGPLRDLKIASRLNGQVMQEATFADLIFPIPELIAYITTFTPLNPGDVIATGTPGGVGYTRQPPVFMKPGDTIEVVIERVGHLVNTVADE